ncbi:MAG: hypothetical protein U9R17_15335 [Thermodesulfobacteriota bacterium]|nr:hypothetical protein [Thermodesulfobacteriota bacterium]
MLMNLLFMVSRIGGHEMHCYVPNCFRTLSHSSIFRGCTRSHQSPLASLVKSLEIVMPDPVSITGQARSGISRNDITTKLALMPEEDIDIYLIFPDFNG